MLTGPPEGLWYHHAPVTRLLIACDFDGTVTRRDTLQLILNHFGDAAAWDRMVEPLRAGRITVEQAMDEQMATVHATREQVLAHLDEAAHMRDGFPEFVAWTRARGHRLVITSNGLRTGIQHLLTRFGVSGLEVHAHDAEFHPSGSRMVWTDRGDRCTECDRPCKRGLVRRLAGGDHVVLIGDGISDRCVSGIADTVLACDYLARHLAEHDRPFIGFQDFTSVPDQLDALVRRAA